MTDPAAVVVLAVAAAACAAAVRWPFIGLLAYLWLDFIRPNDLFVELRDYRVMLIVAAVTAAATGWRQRHRPIDEWRPYAPLAALIVVVAVASAMSVDPRASSATLVHVAKMLVLVWLIATLVTDQVRMRAVFWVIGLSLAVLGVDAIAKAMALDASRLARSLVAIEGPGGLADGPFRDNNNLARVLALALPLWWVLAAPAVPGWARALAITGFAVTVGAIEATFSRSGFLAMLAGVTVIAASYRSWQRRGAALLTFVAALALFSPQPVRQRMMTIAHAQSDVSVVGRVGAWHDGWRMAVEHPWWGQGPGTFQRSAESSEPVRRSSHNTLLEAVAEVGFIGLAVYLWMLIATFAQLHGVRGIAGDTPWLRTTSFGLEAALLAYLTASMALSEPFASPLFVLIGLAIALQRCTPAAATPYGGRRAVAAGERRVGEAVT